MEQYGRSGPKVDPKIQQEKDSRDEVDNLKNRIAQQDQRIDGLERDLRKLRNDMRMAISTFNAIKSNERNRG